MSKLNIIYRACELEVDEDNIRYGRPHWFDKLKCFKSLQDSLVGINNYKIYCIFNGKRKKLFNYIKQFSNTKVVKTKLESNFESLMASYDLISEINLSGSYYFLEDDYLHTKDSIEVLIDGIKKFELVTTYDHPDKYEKENLIFKKEQIKLGLHCHWRTSDYTTCTWACNERIWKEIKNIAYKHAKLTNDIGFFKEIYEKEKKILYTPMYGRSTHLMNWTMSPYINWENINDLIEL